MRWIFSVQWQIIADFIHNPDNFDIDKATGDRLDIIG